MSARFTRALLVAGSLVIAAVPLAAQGTESALTVARIFNSPELFARGFRGARWRPKLDAYTRLERSATQAGGVELVQYDAESGRRDVLLPASRLVPRGESAPIAVE